MNTPERVRYVVAYGGDKRSKAALRLGVQLARSFNADLDVVMVLRTDDPYDPVYPPVGDITGVVGEQARQWLKEAEALVPDDVTVRTHLHRHQSVVQGVLDVAAAVNASLIVAGAASGGRKLAFTVGPFTTALLHAAPIPVALAPRSYQPTGTIRTLYCAVGTRPGAHQVLDEAAEAVRRAGLDLHVISLAEVDAGDGVDEDTRTQAMAHLQDLTARRHDNDVTIEIGQGRTMKQAIDSIDWTPDSVLMIGSSRLAHAHRTFLGTTAARMLRHLPVPMIVVPRPDDPNA